MESSGEAESTIKSVNSRHTSRVTFFNRTTRLVDVVWRNFEGEPVCYTSRLAPEAHYSIDTYVTHPWQAWDSDTLKDLKVGGNSFFYPVNWNIRNERAVVFICDPDTDPSSSMEPPGEGQGPLKSKSSRDRSYVAFFNRTRNPVDVIWKAFNGDNIRYASRLAPSGHYSVNTFVGHPWQAWNSDTLKLLNIGGRPVFNPPQWDRNDGRIVVFIDEPVSALLSLCLEKVKSLVSVDDSDKLGIPRTLAEELKRRRSVEVRDFRAGR